MPAIAFSPLDVLLGIGLAAVGFLVVALVCAGVLAMLQVVLPSTDAGAAEIDRRRRPEDETDQDTDGAPPDTEVDA
jgi:hypothetical protein